MYDQFLLLLSCILCFTSWGFLLPRRVGSLLLETDGRTNFVSLHQRSVNSIEVLRKLCPRSALECKETAVT